MKLISFILVLFVISSCCRPYQAWYTDPLMGKKKELTLCRLTPCYDNSYDCVGATWLNLEHYRNRTSKYKIGLGKMYYSNSFMLNGFANYVYSPKVHPYSTNGISFDGQIGLLPRKGSFTTFIGAEYRFNFLANHSGVFSPSLSFAPPIVYLNSLQLKIGYHFGMKSSVYNAPFFGINYRVPLPF